MPFLPLGKTSGGQITVGGASNSQDAVEVLLSTTTGIDAKSTGTTNLFTASQTTIITKAIVRCTAASAITVGAAAGIGVAAGEDDIFSSETMTGVHATTDAWYFVGGGKKVQVAASDIVKIGIDTAATGTSQTLAVDLWGYEI